MNRVIVIVPELPEGCLHCPVHCSCYGDCNYCTLLNQATVYLCEVENFDPDKQRLPGCPLKVQASVVNAGETVEVWIIEKPEKVDV